MSDDNWLVLGCGYLGARVAARWQKGGGRVFVTTRHLDKAATFAQRGWSPLVGDVTSPQQLPKLPPVEWRGVLWSVGREPGSLRPHLDIFAQGLQNLLPQLVGRTQCLIFTSSTGVYGDANGGWLDENSPVAPDSPGGQACWQGEQIVAQSGIRCSILRMAGLYGPARIPRQQELASGKPLAVAADGYLNLIHIDDAADMVVAVCHHEPSLPLLCVSDGNPVPRRDYLTEIARQMGLPQPTFTSPPPDAPRGRGSTNKRIANSLLLSHFPQGIQYPNYRVGLAAILGGNTALA